MLRSSGPAYPSYHHQAHHRLALAWADPAVGLRRLGKESAMTRWRQDLQRELETLAAQSLQRRLRPVLGSGRLLRREGVEAVNLAGNDYLGLSQHPRLIEAAAAAAQRYGVGAGASRLVSGHLELHEQVEQRFAAFKHAQAALLCPTGYVANLAVLSSLAGPGDLICLDKLCHASLIDAARASGAVVRTWAHGKPDRLPRLLAEHREAAGTKSDEQRAPRRFVVTDSVFSMDGDVADLPTLCDIARQGDAIMLVDEAHGTGVLGEQGAGLCELQGVADRVDIVVSTASKALGGLGGIVTATSLVIQTLVNRARPFIYSTAVTPPQTAVIDAALDVVRDEPWRRRRVLTLADRLHEALCELGLTTVASRTRTPIVPIIVGSAEASLALERHLLGRGFMAPAIRPPTVAPNTARVRLSLRADLEDADLARLVDALAAWPGRGSR